MFLGSVNRVCFSENVEYHSRCAVLMFCWSNESQCLFFSPQKFLITREEFGKKVPAKQKLTRKEFLARFCLSKTIKTR